MAESPYRGFFLPPSDVSYPFRRELEACWELAGWARRLGEDRPFDVRDGANQIVFGEFVRCINNFLAILSLALDGFGVQGELLGRPMFEGYLTGWWADTHPDEANERFRLQATYLRRLHLEARAATGFYEDEPVAPPMSAEDERKAARLFGPRGEKSLAGKSLYELATELQAEIEHSGARSHLRHHQALVHRVVNWSLHSTAYSLKRVAQPDPDREGEGIAIIGGSDLAVRDSLVVGWNCLVLMCGLFIEHFELHAEIELDHMTFKVWRAFKNPDVVDRLGRNDLCPCKSGLKFKVCHDRLRR